MQNLNRRQWLKSAGLAGGAISLLGGYIPNLSQIELFTENQIFKTTDLNKLIRLSSNENPYGPSALVRESMVKAFEKACRYPGSEISELTKKIAEKEGVSPQHILITIGSTEGLKISALAYLRNGGELVAAEPTFEAMLTYAEACSAYVHRVPVNKDLGLDIEAMEKRCNSDTKMVFVCNPNNPTGTILQPDEMLHFCTKMASRTIVFSDEAYFDYIKTPDYPSMTTLVKQDLNVIVSRTFSKVYGLAGLRIGYLIARPDIIQKIKKYQIDRPNMLALVAAQTAMDEMDFYNKSLNANGKALDDLHGTLKNLGLKHTDSHANFIFFNAGKDIQEVSKLMQKENILVGRPFRPLTDWCRISTGVKEDMTVLQAALVKVFG